MCTINGMTFRAPPCILGMQLVMRGENRGGGLGGRQGISFWYINKMVIGLQTVYNALDLLIIRIGVCYLLDMFWSLISLSETYFMLHCDVLRVQCRRNIAVSVNSYYSITSTTVCPSCFH